MVERCIIAVAVSNIAAASHETSPASMFEGLDRLATVLTDREKRLVSQPEASRQM